jgi:DNA polymerase-4
MGKPPRKIIHIDLDAFFCAAEELKDPTLRGTAFAVGGRPETRGVISSCSYAARQHGVHSAIPTARALRLCPGLKIVPPRHGYYGELSDQVMQRIGDLTPLVEPISIDEAFLDVSDLPDSPGEIAERLQARIFTELQLPASLGAASNKLVAKIATDVGKAANRGPNPPMAITVVPPGEEAAFLAPLPVQALWGVGPKSAARLNEQGIHTIGDLAARPEPSLADAFGLVGHELWLRAQGRDDDPVVTEWTAKSVSQETTFARDVTDRQALTKTLRQLADGVARRLRADGLCGSTVKLKLRWSDFTTLTRQSTLAQPTDLDSEIFGTALQLFERTWVPPRPVRLIGVGVTGLGAATRQLALWNEPTERERKLVAAVDALRERFGDSVIRRGSSRATHKDEPE